MNKIRINYRIREDIISKILRVIRFISGTVSALAAFAAYGVAGSVERGLYLDVADRNYLICGCVWAISFFVWYHSGG